MCFPDILAYLHHYGNVRIQLGQDAPCNTQLQHITAGNEAVFYTNYPSAGSPTETLLRLLLPLSDKVHKT